MYTPAQFALDDLLACQGLIRTSSFAELVSVDSDGLPIASHLPFSIDASRGPNGTLVSHMARANPQWQHLGRGDLVLAIFHGPHAYVSPAWYQVQPSVPTWNYVAVHAYGVPRLIEQPNAMREALRRLVDESEAAIGAKWQLAALEDQYRDSMMEQIVAFEIPIQRIEGKAKLSQNRTDGDREAVIAKLAGSSDPVARAVAAAMQAVLVGGTAALNNVSNSQDSERCSQL